MGEAVTTTLDGDLYDEVLEEHNRTGKSKSQVVNERVRAGYNGSEHTLSDTLLPVFGQSLFVVGFIVGFYKTIPFGVSISLIGLMLMIGSKINEYRTRYEVDRITALKAVLGV